MADFDSTTVNTVDTPKDFGTGPQAEVRRWLVELKLARKRMDDWRKGSKKLWDLYHGTRAGRKRNSYNVLYANTEILSPAVYNSLPTPDIRRRFGDADPMGKAV